MGELGLQLEKAGTLRPEDFNLLKRIELDQRQISSRLLNPSDGIEARARDMLAEMRQNRLENAEMQSRLEETVETLRDLQEENLSEIERQLTEARKAAQSTRANTHEDDEARTPDGDPGDRERDSSLQPRPRPQLPSAKELAERVPSETRPASAVKKDTPKPGNSALSPPSSRPAEPASERSPNEAAADQAAALERAAENQSVVIDSLSEMVRQMGEWRDRQQLAGDLREIAEGQKDIARQTAEQGRETLSKRLMELTPQQQADLARLAERQQRHADRLTQFRARLNETAERLDESDSSAAETIRDAAEQLRDQATAGRMRDAAAELSRNNIGEAAGRQQQILDELNELQETLEDRSPSNLESLVKKLKAAEQEVETLRKREEGLQKQLDEALANPNATEREHQLERLRKEQEQIRKDAEAMVRRLRRLDSQRSAAAARRPQN